LTAGVLILVAGYSCKKDISCEGCRDGNIQPKAVAGPDQVIKLPLDSVWLDGSMSSDPDGSIKSYRWREIAGPAPSNIVSPADSVTRVRALRVGLYRFELAVADDGGLSSLDTVQVTIQALDQQNRPPVACAGPEQFITLPVDSVTLDGRCSADLDSNIASYLWTKVSGPASYRISNPDQPLTTVTGLAEGSFVFQLTVRDALGLTSTDTVRVTVIPLVLENDSLDVYVAGNQHSGPMYWKNGQGVVLKISPFQNGNATDIALDGNDVYVAGWEGDFLDMTKNRAKYWKNGQEVFLTGETGAGANAIAVSGTDVYVAGWEMQAGGYVAKYWKNGVAVTLTGVQQFAWATDIAVVGGDVYVSGYDGKFARVWRNGQVIGPVNVGNASHASGIAVMGSDVYLAGSMDGQAAYWRNDQVFILSTGESRASSVYVSGTDVYLAGEVGVYGKSVARYWKNGQETVLSAVSEAMIANSIFVMGNDVYVTGFNYTTDYRAGYWKNGQFVQVGIPRSSQTGSIVVKRR
jgi:hypothetical protein